MGTVMRQVFVHVLLGVKHQCVPQVVEEQRVPQMHVRRIKDEHVDGVTQKPGAGHGPKAFDVPLRIAPIDLWFRRETHTQTL